MNSRATAALALQHIIAQGKNLDTALNPITEDKAFVQTLCYGVCRYYHQLKFIESQLLDKPLKEKDSLVSLLILIGLFQLIYLRTDDYAAVHETVAACKAINKPWAKQLINAVLRKFIRQQTSIMEKLAENESGYYSHPNWFIKQIKKNYPEHWQKILTENNRKAPLTLRINQQRTTRDAYLKQLKQNAFAAAATTHAQHGITLETPLDITQLPAFHEGEFSVQDEAAQLATQLLDVKPHQNILDACAAPGGKTCHILETEPSVTLTAIDNNAQRAQRIDENLQRLHCSANVIIADAAATNTWWKGEHFDRILCDAPCSATGVIRRHPDIKLLRRKTDIDELQQTQLTILNALWPLLKVNGILLYTTCSVLPAENDAVISAFCQQQPSASILPIKVEWGIATECGRQLLPGETDGFYFAKLSKQN